VDLPLFFSNFYHFISGQRKRKEERLPTPLFNLGMSFPLPSTTHNSQPLSPPLLPFPFISPQVFSPWEMRFGVDVSHPNSFRTLLGGPNSNALRSHARGIRTSERGNGVARLTTFRPPTCVFAIGRGLVAGCTTRRPPIPYRKCAAKLPKEIKQNLVRLFCQDFFVLVRGMLINFCVCKREIFPIDLNYRFHYISHESHWSSI
jgi:hypothetical protein